MLEGGCVGSHSLCKVRAASQVPRLPTQSPHSRHRVTSRFPPGSCVHGDSWATTHDNAGLHRTATPVIYQRAHIPRQGRKQQTPSLFHGSCHYTPPSSNIFLGSGKSLAVILPNSKEEEMPPETNYPQTRGVQVDLRLVTKAATGSQCVQFRHAILKSREKCGCP